MIKMNKRDWIPPDQRTAEQNLLANSFRSAIGTFADRGTYVDTPDRVIFAELEKKALGRLLLRVWQQTGSCVGTAANHAYQRAMVGDVLHRGDVEEIKSPFAFATYGVGRKLAGMRGKGEGSFGAAQAKAVETFGMIPIDFPGVPQPKIKDGWATYRASEEYAWSHSDYWPMEYQKVEEEANKHRMGAVTGVNSLDELEQLIAQGYGVTAACMYGTRKPRVRGDVLIGDWDDTWAHQWDVGGYWRHPTHGRLYILDNQWGPTIHGICPTLSKLGVYGSFWLWEQDMKRAIRDGEVFGHSDTDGFPKRDIWGSLGL